VTRSSRLRGQDGFIREVLWVALTLAIIAVVILDGMAIFRAYQSVSDDSTRAAEEASNEYAVTTNAAAARQAAEKYLDKSDLELVAYSATRNAEGNIEFSVTAKATADTYGFKLLAVIPPFKDWVEDTTHPTSTGTSQ
jgi:Flp pilus assembly protein TadG